MAAGGVEDSALALFPDPGPGLARIAFDALGQQCATLGVDAVMDVGFVPCFIGLHILENGVRWGEESGLENGGFMGLETPTDKVDEARLIAKTRAGTMDGKEGVARFDKAE